MVNTPFTDSAVELAKKEGFFDKVGLHLNLYEFSPLTRNITELKNYSDGNVFLYRGSKYSRLLPRHVSLIRAEIEAQIIKFFEYGFPLRHIDSHHYTHLDLPVWLALKPLIKKYKIESVRGIRNGTYSKDFLRKLYVSYLNNDIKHVDAKSISYISSIEKYCMYKDLVDTSNTDGTIELYTHPIEIDGEIIDNYTGGKLLEESVAGIEADKFITYLDILK